MNTATPQPIGLIPTTDVELMLKRLEGEGAVATPGTSAEFGKLIVAETARWGKVVREAGIKAE